MGFSPTMAIQYHLQTIEIAFWQILHNAEQHQDPVSSFARCFAIGSTTCVANESPERNTNSKANEMVISCGVSPGF
jgi:hypothetical protein